MTPWFTLQRSDDSCPVYISRPDNVEHMISILPDALRAAAGGRNFTGESGEIIQLYSAEGALIGVLAGVGEAGSDQTGPLAAGRIMRTLEPGIYMIAARPDGWDLKLTGIGWGLGAYKFDRYLPEKHVPAQLLLTDGYDSDEITAIVRAINRGRDLINTPAGDMGPEELHAEAELVAAKYGAKITSVVGDALLTENYPMIHAVGRAGPKPPRLVEMTWGDTHHPHLAIVGKGITFDTGGLNIKSASGARIMKKDMGGAAHAITLAEMIMANNLPVHLHVALAIAENSIASGSYHPGDVLSSREGLTIEIDNTDAEGRLVLGDALCKVAEAQPDHIIDFATLTGAARVALGPTLPPFFCNRDHLVPEIMASTLTAFDPLWPMPLWQPYRKLLSSPIADMKNAGGSFAGCITAALFLERFVKESSWMHFDVYGWNPSRTDFGQGGGEIFATRALYEWIKGGGVKSAPDPGNV
ncbi:leucyl aminopeptidase family protein [Robiginitomaculum antarcticum]|uniref:leucyl aminopeptidase family protein n=1 Tax=Robiginitomaculum antarcticum TaxID=437507 RepID=UPI001461541B|nr:leucyl aminopeptidase family protein [Robiginitomaculum antarcticum]